MDFLDPTQWSVAFQQLTDQIQGGRFWLAVFEIIWINILLSGDNALVIAMACRELEGRQRFWGMVLGAGAAIFLRIIFTGIVSTLMQIPFLKVLGGVALLWVAYKLIAADEQEGDHVEAGAHLWRAVWIVTVADIVMSLDNVIAIAAAAKGQLLLMAIGLAISIPMIVAGAAIIMALLAKLPILVWAGAALLGWIAGDVIASDSIVQPYLESKFGVSGYHTAELFISGLCAALVVGAGWLWVMSRRPRDSVHGA